MFNCVSKNCIGCYLFLGYFRGNFLTEYFVFPSREYSTAKRCIRKLLEEECSVPKESRSLYMDVLFDGYNPFCRNSLYTPPTEATTPRRTKVERLVTTFPSKLGTNTAAAKIVSTGCVCRSKLSWALIFITQLAFFLALLV